MEEKQSKNKIIRFIFYLLCLGVNILLGFIAQNNDFPVFFDKTGTILVSILGGYFPGIFVALFTCLIEGIWNSYFVYHAIIHIIIAACAAWFSNNKLLKKNYFTILFILLLTIVGGGLDSLVTWWCGGYINQNNNLLSFILGSNSGGRDYFTFLCGALLSDFICELVSVLLALLVIKLLPIKIRYNLWMRSWKQSPMTYADMKKVRQAKNRLVSLRTKIVLLLTIASTILGIVAAVISLKLFDDYTINQNINSAEGAVEYIKTSIDPEKIDEFIEKGEKAPGYIETEVSLQKLRNAIPNLEYVYVYKILEDGCHVVFDLDTEELEGNPVGSVIPFDEAFKKVVPKLLKGEKIDPIISDETYGWLLTLYEPIYDKDGRCVCYAAVDLSMGDISAYERDFLIKLIVLFLGFFVLILTFGLWLAEYHVIKPIEAMSYAAGKFAFDDEKSQGANVEKIRSLKITTGDQVENLYKAFLKTTENSLKYIEDINEKTNNINAMQRGLILVLADMVENRDESTGEHVRKTAAYTEIIMKELKKEGHYLDELTDQFVMDVFSSAPLHDIGKIQVPDGILNKPGKFTDEEFEIMKKHTTAGKNILQQAIETMPEADYLKEASNLAGYHHERWDGKGYPEGLKEDEIPLSARIMAVADVFDALVSKRCYKDAFTYEKAFSIIEEGAGTHFDPFVAKAFLNVKDQAIEIAESFVKRVVSSDL